MAQLITKTLLNKIPRTRDINNESLRDFSIMVHAKLCCNSVYYLIASVEVISNDIIFLCYTIDTVSPSSGSWQYIAYSQFMSMINQYGLPLKRDIYFDKRSLMEVIKMDRLYV